MCRRTLLAFFIMLHGINNVVAADADGWNVNINSESPEKCSIIASSVKEDKEYSTAVGFFKVILYDDAKPIIETNVTIIPDLKKGGKLSEMVTNKPATSYYIDSNKETDDTLVMLNQLKTGKRLFLKHNNVVFVIPLEGFAWGYELCGEIVKGK